MQEDADAMRRALYGANAIHAAAHLIVQYQGEVEGRPFCIVAGLVMEDMRHAQTRKRDFHHEFIRGDLVFRPHVRYTDNNHLGQGIQGMLTDRALYPEDWQYMIDDNGLLVPNPAYGDFDYMKMERK